ncbi:diguanylate cyclase [Azospirillaceae bacterium]
MPRSTQPFTILIVDDNQNNLFSLHALLEETGEYTVIVANSGEKALEITIENSVDLILLDVQMPGMDGFETARLLQMTERTRQIPIVFVTAFFKTENFAQHGFTIGAVDYITKPIDDNQLLNRIRLYRRLQDRQTRLKLALDQIKIGEERFRFAVDALQGGLWDWRIDNNEIYFSPRWEIMTGYAPGAAPMLLQTLEQQIHPHDLPLFRQKIDLLLSGAQIRIELEHRLRCGDNRFLWVSLRCKSVDSPSHAERPTRIVGVHADISAHKEAEKQSRLASMMFDSMSDAVMVLNDQKRIIAVNPSFSRTYGYASAEIVGQTADFLVSDRHDSNFFTHIYEDLVQNGKWQGEIWNRRKDGEIYPEWMHASMVSIEENEHCAICIYSDLATQEYFRKRLHYLAFYDTLTGLPNRELLRDRIDTLINTAKRTQQQIAVLFIDLDRFKAINDSLGHQIGDELLKQVGHRIKSTLRSSDIIARLGGDEFCVALFPVASIEGVLSVATKIIEAIQPTVTIGEHSMHVGASVGISLFPEDGETIDVLLRNADTAMYQAKDSGRNRVYVFSQRLFEDSLERFKIEGELQEALRENQFRVFYQPFVHLDSGELTGAEALVRWQHPQRGLLSPDKFMDVANACGLISQIDAWVLSEACRQVTEWEQDGFYLPRIAVNLAGNDIEHQEFIRNVALCLEHAGLAARRLELEISESFFIKNEKIAITALNRLRSMGIWLSVDDFGTGYSSLSQIRRLPIDRLKIDRSFIADIPDSVDAEAVTRAVIAMGTSLNLDIIAEGVEVDGQRQFLIKHRCQEGQGYLFSRPVSAEEFLTIAKQYKCRNSGFPFTE